MNKRPETMDIHQIIVPGYVGIKNIKWITEIVLEDEEIDSPDWISI